MTGNRLQNSSYSGYALHDGSIIVETRPGKPGYVKMGPLHLTIAIRRGSPKIVQRDYPGSYQDAFGLAVECNGSPVRLTTGRADHLGRRLEWYFDCEAGGEKFRFRLEYTGTMDIGYFFIRRWCARFQLSESQP